MHNNVHRNEVNMRTTIHKVIWVWNFDKEEKWLNEMAAKGLCLVSVGLFRYEFEDCEPGEYQIRMQMLENRPNHPESQKYMEFLEGTNVEHVGSCLRWAYFRKKTADGEFEIFSDNESRVKYLTQVIRFIALLTFFNLYIGVYNTYLAIAHNNVINYIGFVNIAISFFAAFGIFKLMKKRDNLKREGQVFE